MQQYAVFGNPIKQSKSPQIHKMFAQQCGMNIDYHAKLSSEAEFKSDLANFFAIDDVVGCNVTAPFKQQAFEFADSCSAAVTVSGAVNTLHKDANGKIKGFNTDGGGLVNDMLQQNASFSGNRVLMIGAGGAARGVLVDLLAQQPQSLTIANRTLSTAEALVAIGQSQQSGVELEAKAFDALEGSDFDIVINATTLSLHNKVPDVAPSVLRNTHFVYDMVYGDKPTAFMDWALEQGAAQVSDGLGMLVGQAALSFEIWTGHSVDTQPVAQALRQ